MPAIRINHILAAALAALVASFATTALAVAGDAKPAKVISDPYLVVTSGGAYVDYDLGRTAASQRVTIDGQKATVKVLDKGAGLHRALVTRAGLKLGREYRVRITVRTKAGTTATLSERLYLHKRGKVEQ